MLSASNANGHLYKDELGTSLNILFASALDLASHATQARWCVAETSEWELEQLFNDLSHDARNNADYVASLVRRSGRSVSSTVRAIFQCSVLPDYPLGKIKGSDHIGALRESILQFGQQVRRVSDLVNQVPDRDLMEPLNELSRRVQQMLLQLEPHLMQTPLVMRAAG